MSNLVAASGGIKFRLCIMMFLEFFIWGAWFELNFGYLPTLGFTPLQQNLILWAFNVGAVFALFFGTQFADRTFAAEKFLAFSQLIGGLAILGLFFIVKPADGESAPFWPFFILMLVHSLFYVPTLSIVNSIAFAHLKDPQREFGAIRVWGTIGWIAASWPFIFILVDWNLVPEYGSVPFSEWIGSALSADHAKKGADFRYASRYIFLVAGIASLTLALFSLILPHTPPKPRAQQGESLAWWEAIKFLRRPFVAVLFLVTFIDSIVHASFFYWTERFLTGPVHVPSNWALPVMKIGQVAEIITMIFLGYVLKRLGWRITMIIGVLGYTARFAVFAFTTDQVPVILINVLHGICYAFFFATVYIFIDEYFPKDIGSSAQGLFNFVILGIGPIAGNYLCGKLGEMYTTSVDAQGVPNGFDFSQIFLYPCAASLFGALLLLIFFHPPKIGSRSDGKPEKA